ncbi:MAG TPA: hypothetical protein VFL57_09760, partial [Bryobacteraceae bacterium]|nr:hypothetical protein [Bryobacteraceae bacterium]
MALRAAALFLTLCAGVHSEQDATDLFTVKLLARISAIDAAIEGALGVAAVDLATGRIIAYNAGTAFPQASVIKV